MFVCKTIFCLLQAIWNFSNSQGSFYTGQMTKQWILVCEFVKLKKKLLFAWDWQNLVAQLSNLANLVCFGKFGKYGKDKLAQFKVRMWDSYMNPSESKWIK
jgi:hypothetical protein